MIAPGKKRKNGYNIYPELAAAALWITPTDLAKLIIELQLTQKGQSAKVLSSEVFQTMLTPPIERTDNALGTFLHNEGNGSYFQHSGGNEGFNCLYYASVNQGHGAIVMINAEKFELINEIMRSIAKAYNWGVFQPQVVAQVDAPSDDVLKGFSGTYRSVDFTDRTVEISFEKGQLYIEQKKRWKSKLIPKDANTFLTADINPAVTIEFEEGKLIVEQGKKYEWIKE